MRPVALVGIGAAAGALLRWGIAEIADVSRVGFPWPTLLVNLIGCVVIGVAARRLAPATDAWFAGITGLLGGFTTFSTFANEVWVLADEGRAGLAGVYVIVSLAGGLVGVEAGRVVAR